MTPENQRLALAKCGFKQTYHECTCPEDCGRMIPDPSPDYLHDLNAVHELEMKLDAAQQSQMLGQLALITKHGDYITFATAAQRCEALLRTLELWED